MTTVRHPTLQLLVVACLLGPRALCAQSVQRDVETRVYLVDLVEIDGAAQTFFADVFVATRWSDPGLLERTGPEGGSLPAGEVWTPGMLILNQRQVRTSLRDIVQVLPDGMILQAQRYTGLFSAKMDLRDFPLDDQTLEIAIVAVPSDNLPVQVRPGADLLLRNETMSISDWTVDELTLSEYEFSATPEAITIYGVKLDIPVNRLTSYYILKVLIPLVAVVLMAWTVFWIDPKVVPTRVGVVVTTMLTLIAYRFTLSGLVPPLSYLTKLDYLTLFLTIGVLLALFSMAATSYLQKHEREEIVGRIDRTGRVGFPLFCLLSLLASWML